MGKVNKVLEQDFIVAMSQVDISMEDQIGSAKLKVDSLSKSKRSNSSYNPEDFGEEVGDCIGQIPDKSDRPCPSVIKANSFSFFEPSNERGPAPIVGMTQYISKNNLNDDLPDLEQLARSRAKLESNVKLSIRQFRTEKQGEWYHSYELIGHVGQGIHYIHIYIYIYILGGFASIKKVRNRLSGEIRALKKIPKTTESIVKPEDEFENLKQLDHPHVIRLFEFFQDDDYFYLITE